MQKNQWEDTLNSAIKLSQLNPRKKPSKSLVHYYSPSQKTNHIKYLQLGLTKKMIFEHKQIFKENCYGKRLTKSSK